MTPSFVQGNWTEGATSNKEITMGSAATAGNLIVVMVYSSLSEGTAPKLSNDAEGETGWTVEATAAKCNASKSNVWVAWKKAVGGEKVLKATPGKGTTIGVGFVEWSGADTTTPFSAIEHTDNVDAANLKEHTSGAFSSVAATDAVMLGITHGSTTSMGTVEEWTGGPPTLKLPAGHTATGRGFFGYEAPGSKVEGKTFTAHHSTARNEVGFLWVAIKAAAGGVVEASAVLTLKDTFGASQPTAVSAIQTTLTLAGKFRAINEPTTEVGARVVLSVAEVLTAKEQQAQSASYTVTLTTVLKGKAVATGGTPTVKRTIIFIIDE